MMQRRAVAWLAVLLLSAGLFASVATRAQETTKSKSGKGGGALQEKLVAIEKQVWKAFSEQDIETFKGLVAADGWSIDASGIASLEQMVETMGDWEVDDYSLEGFRTIPLGKEAAILVYTAYVTASYRGEPLPEGPVYVSTVFASRGGKWMPVFHQETMAMAGEMPQEE